jgi:prophage regulatory protein
MDTNNVNSARNAGEAVTQAGHRLRDESFNATPTSLTSSMFERAGITIPHGARVLRIKEVVERTGLSRSTVYVLMKSDPTFPKKVSLSARTAGVIERQLDEWIASRVLARNA